MDSDPNADDSCQSEDGTNLRREVGGSRSRAEFLELILAHLTDAIFVIEPDGRIIEANPAGCSMLGHSIDESLGKRSFGFVTNVFGDDMLDLIRSTKPGTTAAVQRPYRRTTGEQGCMDLRLGRFECLGGDLFVASCRDLTQQKQLEERLRDLNERRSIEEELRRLNVELSERAAHLRHANQSLIDSEQRLRLAIETGRIGLWVWNSTDVTNSGDWSNRLKEIFGLPLHAEVTHDMFLKCVHPEDRERVDQLVMQALAGVNGGEYRAEYRAIHPGDGSEGWVTARGQAFFDSEGKPIRFIGTVMDITERKRAEESSMRLHLELEQRIAERTADLAEVNRALQAEIEARKRAEEALRASENLARGQLEALTNTLTALSKESEPEKFLEHVLRAIGLRLGAHSIGVWELNEPIGSVDLIAVFEGDRLHLATPEERQIAPEVVPAPRNNPVWAEFFRSGEHCVFCEIHADTIRVRLADGPDTHWYDWFGEQIANPFLPALAKRLYQMGIVATICVPIFVGGKVTGLISVRFLQTELPLDSGEIELARALAHQAMLAIQLIRLSQQSRQAAVIAERNRMAREIHDTLAQGLTGVIVQLEAAEDASAQNLAKAAATHIERAGEMARESLQEARRSVHALRPLVLAGKNLCAAIEELTRKMTAGTNLRAEFTMQGEAQSIPQKWEENLLRVSQEVLTNTLRHAHASQFKVHLTFDPQTIRMELRDDGIGFDPAKRYDGFGLLGVKERVESMGGELTVESTPGSGAATYVTLPLMKYPPNLQV